ncbi:MAG: Crp/Fnr family transcriptional regulator [Cyanobacteria bacterium P01_D01_bin.128]
MSKPFARKTLIRCTRRSLVPVEKNQLWFIRSGMVRAITWDEQGQVAPLGFWGPGNLIGSELNPITPYAFECLNVVELEPLKIDVRRINHALLSHMRQSSELMKILYCRRIESRLFQLIRWLGDNFGHRSGDRICMSLPLTHQQLAESIGSTRVTVTRLLHQFERSGQLHWSRQHQSIRVGSADCMPAPVANVVNND